MWFLLACVSLERPSAEACNGIDDDGDGLVDEDFDRDGDLRATCDLVTQPIDCNDANAAVYPGAPERCDGLDDDCDGVVPAPEQDFDADGELTCGGDCDDGDPTVHGWDEDGDGYTPCQGDCDDEDATIGPGDEMGCGETR